MPKRKAPPTAWKPGQSGNPDGRQIEKLMADQVRLILNETVEIEGKDGTKRKFKQLRLLAEAAVTHALAGSAPHLAMIWDRIDGKVPNVNHNTNEVGKNTLEALLKAIDGRSRDIVAPQANGHDTATDEDTVH